MNYEEKYKRALERAKDMLSYNEVRQEDMEYLFPELKEKESEDERIRKGLINGFKECLEDCQYPKNAVKYWHNVEVDNILAWLEKQGDKSVNIDIESMVSSYEQRLESQDGTKYTPLVSMCLTSFRHGVENVLEELNLKKLEKQGKQKQTWKPSEAQLIVIENLIKDKNTSNVNKTILRGMLNEFKQFTNTHKREIDDYECKNSRDQD